ncbi:MAG: hypothetical protein CSA95_09025 [Bacteroidetes bacterium]|nr:MAG: hypothetical protein CSA95_09025 [Bacteroidota bacterium]
MAFLGGSAQDLDINDVLGRYFGANGDNYIQPVADAFGANMNSGLFHTAYIRSGMKFQLYFGLQTMFAYIPESSKSFEAKTEGDYFPEMTVEGVPTICGDPDGKIVEGPEGTKYYFPGGFDLDYLPYATPQLTVGSLYGTDFTVRLLSARPMASRLSMEEQEWINSLYMLGWGVRHNISQWLDLSGMEIAVGYYRQTLSSEDYIDIRSRLISLQFSYNLAAFTLYAGVGFETSSMILNYHSEELSVDFDLSGINKVRTTIGATFNMGPVKLSAEYNLSKQRTFSVGLGVGFNDFKRD